MIHFDVPSFWRNQRRLARLPHLKNNLTTEITMYRHHGPIQWKGEWWCDRMAVQPKLTEFSLISLPPKFQTSHSQSCQLLILRCIAHSGISGTDEAFYRIPKDHFSKPRDISGKLYRLQTTRGKPTHKYSRWATFGPSMHFNWPADNRSMAFMLFTNSLILTILKITLLIQNYCGRGYALVA